MFIVRRSVPKRPSSLRCLYHSYEHAPAEVYQPAERAILTSAMTHVPNLGFTLAALQKGATETGHLEITHNLFPRGAFDLIQFHLHRERLGLQHKKGSEWETIGTGKKIQRLCTARLRANEPYIQHMQDALGVMSLPSNVGASLSALHALSDEMWHLVDDQSANMSWYTKRMTLSGVYASAELFMTQDTSPDFKDTWAFLDRRLKDVALVGSTVTEVSQFVGFQLWQAKNILASKGFKI